MLHTTEWPVHVYLSEDGDTTTARVVISTRDNTLSAVGVATRNPHDKAVPEIGDEIAVGRAFAELGRMLLGAAVTDVASNVEDPEPVSIRY
jgi:hypothetical protein